LTFDQCQSAGFHDTEVSRVAVRLSLRNRKFLLLVDFRGSGGPFPLLM
jgi:hypothetical protein